MVLQDHDTVISVIDAVVAGKEMSSGVAILDFIGAKDEGGIGDKWSIGATRRAKQIITTNKPTTSCNTSSSAGVRNPAQRDIIRGRKRKKYRQPVGCHTAVSYAEGENISAAT